MALDTSGELRGSRLIEQPDGNWRSHWRWSDLSPFVQGTLTAASEELQRALEADPGNYLDGGGRVEYIGPHVRFDMWSPEALALILRDCEAAGVSHREIVGAVSDRERRLRGAGAWQRSGLTPYLADDSKVHLREGSP